MMDGAEYKVHYYACTSSLHIWVLPVPHCPGACRGRSGEACGPGGAGGGAVLQRSGGWQLGLPRFLSNGGQDSEGIHYATNDPAIMGNLPEGYAPKDKDFWVDGTPPPLSLETDKAAKADAVIGFYELSQDLKSANKDMASRLEANEKVSLKLVRISENLERAIGSMQSTEAHLIEQRSRELIVKIKDAQGAMYQ